MTRNRKRPRDDEEDTEEDSVRALKELIESEKCDDAWARFAKTVEAFKGDGEEADDEKCNPIKIKPTWEGDEDGPGCHWRSVTRSTQTLMQRQKKRKPRGSGEEVEPGEDLADNRAGRVVGIHLGSGCGKTHLLLEAPRLLQRPGIYVTAT